MFIIVMFIIYILAIVLAIVTSIKSFVVSTTLIYLLNKFLGDKIKLIFNYNSLDYCIFMSLIYFFFFTIFFGIFIDATKKFTQMDVKNLFSVIFSWILLLYGRMENHMIISFIAVNCLNFSAIKLYFSKETEKGHAIYFTFGLYSIICGWMFAVLFVFEYYDYLNIYWIISMIILSIYYYVSCLREGIKFFFR